MQLILDRKEIEAVLLEHANKMFVGAQFNEIDWDCGYRSVSGATFTHTDLPPEKADE